MASVALSWDEARLARMSNAKVLVQLRREEIHGGNCRDPNLTPAVLCRVYTAFAGASRQPVDWICYQTYLLKRALYWALRDHDFTLLDCLLATPSFPRTILQDGKARSMSIAEYCATCKPQYDATAVLAHVLGAPAVSPPILRDEEDAPSMTIAEYSVGS